MDIFERDNDGEISKIDHFAVVHPKHPSLRVNVRLTVTSFWYKPPLLCYGNCH